MKYLTGEDRQQIPLFLGCLVEAIESDNEVRLIDAFVEALPLGDFGFKVDHLEIGRPAYHPADLLKLYLYGYLNRSRCGHDVYSLQPAPDLQPFAPKRAPSLAERA
jgi:transposase